MQKPDEFFGLLLLGPAVAFVVPLSVVASTLARPALGRGLVRAMHPVPGQGLLLVLAPAPALVPVPATALTPAPALASLAENKARRRKADRGKCGLRRVTTGQSNGIRGESGSLSLCTLVCTVLCTL